MRRTIKQNLPYILLIASVVGLVAAFSLTYDKIQVLKDPHYHPSCNINPILSCGSVMETEQASLLGMPNTVFGIMGFSILGTIAVTMLAGARFGRRFWLVVNAGVLVGFTFFLYLFFQGVYRINAICPYCFLIWMIMPPVLLYVTAYNLREGNLKLSFVPAGFKRWLLAHHGDVLIAWYAFIFLLLGTHFWYYWKTLLPGN